MKPGRIGLAELATLILALSVLPLAMASRNDQPPHILVSSAYQPPQKCTAAQQAIGQHRRAYTKSRLIMRLTGAVPRVWYPCPAARRRAVEWRDKAWQAKRAFAKWHEYHYDWQKWLPYNWYRVGSCESGYGGPPNWEHTGHSRDGYFVSGFGISAREYDKDAAVYGAPPWHVRHTPRDQYLAALGHYKRFGDGWSCPGP